MLGNYKKHNTNHKFYQFNLFDKIKLSSFVYKNDTIQRFNLLNFQFSQSLSTINAYTANSSRTWRIKAEGNNHFGLGPVGGAIITEWYGAPANSKANTGMYDDRFTFNANGTFSHDTGVDGTVFGRKVLIEELNGPGGVADGADILQYPYASYSGQYILTAPNSVETITLTGLGFIGYYIGGNHQYRIFKRENDEIVLSTADGNNEFEWWFVLVPAE